VTEEELAKQKHFEWLIESRSRNQRSALKLRSVLRTYERQWKTRAFSSAAQELSAISFSLWRAAFLAEKTGSRAAVFKHAAEFLDKVIEDNSISYGQDKASREWTFNYYTRNARYSLEYLHDKWPELAHPYEVKNRTPKLRWEYCQDILDRTILNFEMHFKNIIQEQSAAKASAKAQEAANVEKKTKRAKVRKMQIDARSD
jgi:hypothetical protein